VGGESGLQLAVEDRDRGGRDLLRPQDLLELLRRGEVVRTRQTVADDRGLESDDGSAFGQGVRDLGGRLDLHSTTLSVPQLGPQRPCCESAMTPKSPPPTFACA